MKKTIIALFISLVALFGSVPIINSAIPTTTFESQVWWNKAGISVPNAVGSHIHVKAIVPQDGTIVSGVVNVPVTVTLHRAAGKTNWIRVHTESTELFKTSLVMGPCTDCTQTLTLPVDFSRSSSGRHEIRISVNIPDEDLTLSGSQRMFQSTGAQVCIKSCSPSYRAANFLEARGWYTGNEYQNARLTSPLSTVKAGGTISVKLAPGSNGKATKFSGIYINPDFHNGKSGTILKETNGPFTGSIKLPTTLAAGSRVVLVTSDGQEAGVLVLFSN